MFDDDSSNLFSYIVTVFAIVVVLISVFSCGERVDTRKSYLSCLEAAHDVADCRLILPPGE